MDIAVHTISVYWYSKHILHLISLSMQLICLNLVKSTPVWPHYMVGAVFQIHSTRLFQISLTVDMPIIPIETCRNSWDLDPDVLHNDHICCGSLQGGVSACDLDRGGALIQDGEIIGIVSFGTFPCAQPNLPSVYVRVSAYISWIQVIIDNNYFFF